LDKTISASTLNSNAENGIVSESSQKPAPDKGNNHGPDLVPGEIVVGGELSKKGSPKRVATDDKTSRCAQLEHRGSPKRPKVVHPPALVELWLHPSRWRREIFASLTSWIRRTIVIWTWSLVYLHDIIVFSHSVERHLERLRKLFDRLRDACLKLKPSNCCLKQKRVSFLGYRVCQSIINGADQSLSPPDRLQLRRLL